MTSIRIHHILCGSLFVPPYNKVPCRCSLLETANGLVLIDSGIGLLDVQNPVARIGQQLIEMAGFQFHEAETAVRQIEQLGLQPRDVRHIVLTHADPDHAGGLADFPNAQVHISAEEHSSLSSGNWRYLPIHFAHSPLWNVYCQTGETWFGLESRPISGFNSDVLLIPLFGHTKGHCGVAVKQAQRWLLHVGDAYYLRAELASDDHPVSELATKRADDNHMRLESINQLRRLQRDYSHEIDLVCYHDSSEHTS